MNLTMSTEAAYWIIALMALITLITRFAGAYFMSFVPINARVQRFIGAMSSSVLIALLTPIAIQGDMGAKAALAVTALVLLVLKKPLLAIVLGLCTAAMCRYVLSL